MLSLDNCALVLVDVQGKLARTVHGSSTVIANMRKLIQCCKLLEIPIVWLEQNPKGLGRTVPDLTELLTGYTEVLEKTHFNALFERDIKLAMEKTGKQQLLVAGIEAHVCVYQTVSGLLQQGLDVEVVIDCVASRTSANCELAVKKMQTLGASLTSMEMCVFELAKRADTSLFRQLLPLLK